MSTRFPDSNEGLDLYETLTPASKMSSSWRSIEEHADVLIAGDVHTQSTFGEDFNENVREVINHHVAQPDGTIRCKKLVCSCNKQPTWERRPAPLEVKRQTSGRVRVQYRAL